MNKLLNKKRHIIKFFLVILAIAGILLSMDGVKGLGKIEAQAAQIYPDKLGKNDEIYLSEDRVHFCFCYYADEAQSCVDAYTGVDVLSQTSYWTEGNSGSVVTPPSSIGGTSNFLYWEKIDKKTVESPERTVVAYAPVMSMTVKYKGGAGSSTELTDTVESTVTSSGTQTVNIELKSGDDLVARDRYRFMNWSDSSNDYHEAGETVSVDFSANGTVEFTAMWERWIDVYYSPNGGKGSDISNPTYFSGRPDIMVTETLASADFTREGYKLAGWKVNDKTYKSYIVSWGEKTRDAEYEYGLGDNCYHGSGIERIYFDAIWERLPEVDLDIQYKPNGGTGDVVTQSKKVDLSEDLSGQLTLLDKADFKKSGYTLSGWSDGNKTYKLGDTYKFTVEDDELSKSIAFDAVWTEKTKGTVDISIKKPAYVGAEIKYDIEKNSKGDVKVEYKKKDAKDDDYSDKAPTEPGKYTVRATLEETDEYTSAEDTTDFELVYLDAPESPFTYTEVKNSAGTVTDLNAVPTTGYSIGISGSADGTFGASVLYSSAKTAGGVYLRRESDKAITGQVQLTEYSVKDTPSITVKEKVYYGEKLSVTASSKSPADKTITYAKAGSSNSSFTSTVPTEPGKYTVRLTAPASGFYAAVDEKKDFEIVYLETPGKLAYLDGKDGDKGWFRSEVKIKAPTGYEISTTLTGTYSTSIDWSDKITKLYYRRTSDGATTDGINFNPDAKIDGDAPSVNFEGSLKVNSEKKVSVFLDEMTFTIVDDNLYEVTVDGVKQTVSHGRCEIKLAAGTDTETLKVVAKDEAGNTYEFTIELSPQWMETNTMPVGRQVTLKSNIAYSFASGSDYMIDNDDTVYAGGNQFYVRGNMSCTISQKTKAK